MNLGLWSLPLMMGGAAIYIYYAQKNRVSALFVARGGAGLYVLERRARHGGRKGRRAARRLRDARLFDARAWTPRRHPSWSWARDVRPEGEGSLLVREVGAGAVRDWLGGGGFFDAAPPMPEWLNHAALGFFTAKAAEDGARLAAEAAVGVLRVQRDAARGDLAKLLRCP